MIPEDQYTQPSSAVLTNTVTWAGVGQLVRLKAGLLDPTETWRQWPCPSWGPHSKGWLQVLASLSFFKLASEGSSCRHGLMLPEALLEFDDPLVQKSGCVGSVVQVLLFSQTHILT